eukprot:CAMPEP_0181309878 /NCGR_PEP_ID=MMETSP1101-20121128/12260_1 /TAXON_ID=46948 /ORGANISM="Rhodomonas abbreviata, Strain Caron Lab Isolate" /LENGTH=495 /DNA_ID=CAMNT_0023416415 /DNA_START=70 /DNA_END=1554 /DNA_ORIENTATION=+
MSSSKISTCLLFILVSQAACQTVRWRNVSLPCPITREGVECGAGTCVRTTTVTEGEERFGRIVNSAISKGICECPSDDTEYFGGGPRPCVSTDAAQEAARERQEEFRAAAEARANITGRCDDGLMLCRGEWVHPDRLGECVERPWMCNGNQSIERIQQEVEACESNGTKFCPGMGCIPLTVDCWVPSERCPRDKPRKCRFTDICVENITDCPRRDGPNVTCEEGMVVCPDGMTCQETMRECARRIGWDGCEEGMVHCTQRPGMCAESEEECVEKTGCPMDKRVCGVLREGFEVQTDENGDILFNCQDSCASEVQRVVGAVLSSIGRLERTRNESRRYFFGPEDGSPIAGVYLDSSVTADEEDAEYEFAVSHHPDSAMRFGAFRSLVWRIAGALIAISPSGELSGEVGAMKVLLPVTDDTVENEEDCVAATQLLEIWGVHDVYDETEEAQQYSVCEAVYDTRCWCEGNVPHFSTFATVVGEAADEADDGVATDDEV